MKKLSILLLVIAVFFAAPQQSIAATVTLAWCRSPEPDVAGYRLYYGSGITTNWQPEVLLLADTNNPCGAFTYISRGSNWFRAYSTNINVGNVTNATVSDLTYNIDYYFSVTAYNTSGLESEFSNEIKFTPIRPKPLPPSNFRKQ